MDKLRNYKHYKILKRFFFISLYHLFKIINIKNNKFYLAKWIIDNGDETHLVDYHLNPESIVVDVGGYTGNFSDKIVKLYNPQLIILEPVKTYFKILSNKYTNNKNVTLHEYGLSSKDSLQKIYISNDGTSLIKKSNKYKKIKLVDAAKFFNKLNAVDLVSINIEGAEYDVIERLIKTGVVKKIKFLQVQFHSFVPNSINRRKDLLKKILKTHNVHFSYPFVWESFKLKD